MTLEHIPDAPGMAGRIATALADANVNIDMIIQNEPVVPGAGADMSFTVPRADLRDALSALASLAEELGIAITTDESVGKVSVIGEGMKTQSGVAAQVFTTLGAEQVNIQMISTSPIKISCVIDLDRVPDAVRALHGAFLSCSAVPSFAAWSFTGQWRGYQEACLEAFEADRAAGRHQTLLVAPPGSGKTIVGLEIVRRLELPALVLCPTRTIQRQWREKQALFGPPSADLHALTYQSLCQTTDPEGMLRDAARRAWARERAGVTGQPLEEVLTETAAWTGQAAQRRERDVARLVAGMKRRVAAGALPDLPAAAAAVRRRARRVEELRDAGVRVVVLDECHHLLSLWGALVKAVLDLLGPEHVLGLTATNPRELTQPSRRRCMPSCSTARTSRCRRRPSSARASSRPTRSSSQLCTPLHSEHEWLADRHARFELVLEQLASVPAGAEHLGLDVWLLARARRAARAGRRAALVGRARAPPAAARRCRVCAGCTPAARRRPRTRPAASATARR